MNRVPDGLSFFYTSKDMTTPLESAAKAYRAGATHNYLLVWSVDGRHPPVERVVANVDAVAKKHMTPCFYIFPVDTDVAAAEAHLDACRMKTGVIDVCLDLEPYHEKDDVRTPVNEDQRHDWSAQEMSSLISRLRMKGYRISISIFPRKVWHELDWLEILGDTDVEVLFQLYLTIADPVKAAREVQFFTAQKIPVVVCVGSYLGAPSLFRRDLERAKVLSSMARVGVWALGTTSEAEADEARAFVVGAWPAP